VSALLFEFNGEALSSDVLARRMAELRGLETAFLAERGGEAAGLLVLRTLPTLSDQEDWAEITEMYVRPSFRRQDTGRALVEAALEHCRRRGCSEVHLLVDPANREGQLFYEAVGFRCDSWEMLRGL
jgi:ribosomal protein S18 acetylase RimI-like enzyme